MVSISPVHTTVILGSRSSPTVCRYGDFETLGEHSESQYSEGEKKVTTTVNLHVKLIKLCSLTPANPHLWGRIGRQVVHPRTDRPRWLQRPERGRMKRRPRCRPGTRSDRCHRTGWRMPGNPGLTPAERDAPCI